MFSISIRTSLLMYQVNIRSILNVAIHKFQLGNILKRFKFYFSPTTEICVNLFINIFVHSQLVVK